MNAFHICGAIFAAWALLVAFLGITREDFPGNLARLVGAISVLLALLAVGTAIYTGATHEEEHDEGQREGEESSLLLPSL